jgi:hypothetical protein
VLADSLVHPRAEVRAHAVWAAARLGLRGLLPVTDGHEMVRDELEHLPPLREPA